MKNCKLLVLLLSVCIACHATLQSGNAHFIVKNLKTEYAVTPLGLDVELPRFSWQMESLGAERGLQQRKGGGNGRCRIWRLYTATCADGV